MMYLITYDHTQTVFSPTDIHKTITTMPHVTDWWHYLPNVYIVSARLLTHSKELADVIRTAHNGLKFFIVRVDLSDHNGVLNKDAWDWINKKTDIAPRLRIVKSPQLPPITSSSPLLDLLGIKPQQNPNLVSIVDLLKKISGGS